MKRVVLALAALGILSVSSVMAALYHTKVY